MDRDAHLCQPCKKRGRITLATECDHILPISKGGTDDEANLQAICTDCHKVKTDREAGAKPVVGCDADGWPEQCSTGTNLNRKCSTAQT